MQHVLNSQTLVTSAVFFICVRIYGKKYNPKDLQLNMEIIRILALNCVTSQHWLFYHQKKYQQLLIKLNLYYLKIPQELLSILKRTIYMEELEEILEAGLPVIHAHYSHLRSGL